MCAMVIFIKIVFFVLPLGMHSEGKLLTCDQSVDKLVKLLEENKFDSGAHIDYYDV